jgi:hypothetical protein
MILRIKEDYFIKCLERLLFLLKIILCTVGIKLFIYYLHKRFASKSHMYENMIEDGLLLHHRGLS